MDKEKYVIGLDYGTDSVRALVVNVNTGEEAGTGVWEYSRWKKGRYCDPARNMFRQHPLDYIEGLEKSVSQALSGLPREVRDNIAGITADTTGSTPVAVDEFGIPLALKPGYEENPNAMFILWKDHTAVKEAEEINNLARSWGGPDYTKYEGGIYSSEWFWAKILHVLRQDSEIGKGAWSWIEHCDWIPALLTGVSQVAGVKRSRCAAGHKAMWHPDWEGLPAEEFLQKLDPLLRGLRERLYTDTYTSDVAAGIMTDEWAERLGLPRGVTVGVGAFDAHLGAVGGEIRPYYMSKVMGTSTCDMVTVPADEFGDRLVPGICGQVDGSIIPGMIGLEAGQSAFGDVYAWFRDLLMWPLENLPAGVGGLQEEDLKKLREEVAANLIGRLAEAAEKVDPEESGLIAVDWLNGRRTPDASQVLKGAVGGLTLGSDAPAVFRALVEATAFGARAIIERFVSEGVRIDGVVALGGVAKKSPFVMQIVTDVLDMPVSVVQSNETCALGSAMAASVAAGMHGSFVEAQKVMGGGFEKEYTPRAGFAEVYSKLYRKYLDFARKIEKLHH
ncbi:MAG: ribulokinase [Marinilabiliales bacterium]|nr:MAG: ribulokinase [Marinilabiliales bacterium]